MTIHDGMESKALEMVYCVDTQMGRHDMAGELKNTRAIKYVNQGLRPVRNVYNNVSIR